MSAATPPSSALFSSVDDVANALRATGYIPSVATATAVFLADRLGKPLLVEGPAGVGKTELARACAQASEARFLRLQCYEGIDEARALYEWNHAKQILRIQSTDSATTDWDETKSDVFADEFLLPRPLLQAVRDPGPSVLLIDEADKADLEFEGLLLEVLSDYAVTVPELGTIVAQRKPLVFLTSNATRELSEALKRRCLYLHIDFPTPDLELAIIASRVPELDTAVAQQLLRVIATLRTLDLKKRPSVSETLDWCRTVLALGVTGSPSGAVDKAALATTLGVVLKHQVDIETATAALGFAP